MAKTYYINGVNWSTIKKIAKYVFGKDNCLNFRYTNQHTFIIYVEKKYYYSKEELIRGFESEWLVDVRPLDR